MIYFNDDFVRWKGLLIVVLENVIIMERYMYIMNKIKDLIYFCKRFCLVFLVNYMLLEYLSYLIN